MINIFNVFLLLLFSFCAMADQNMVVGVGTHFHRPGKDIDGSLGLIKEAGIAAIRDDIYWGHVERKKNDLRIPPEMLRVLSGAKKNGTKVLLILDYGNALYGERKKPFSPEVMAGYKKYVEYVTSQLNGLVWGYEIWNEWDGKAGNYNPGDPQSYVALVKEVSPIVRKNCSTCVILAGGVTYTGITYEWHKRILASGLMDYVDGLSLHPYVESFKPPKNTPEWLVGWLDKIEIDAKIITNAKEVPIYITELGWSESNGYDSNVVADFFSRTLSLLSQRSYIKGLWWYEFQNSGLNAKDGEHNYGMVDYFGKPKPAYLNLKKQFLDNK